MRNQKITKQEESTFGINGLIYIPNYISSEMHDWLFCMIENQDWDTSLKRRVQHYGYRYDYKKRIVTQDMYIGKLPQWLESRSRKIY